LRVRARNQVSVSTVYREASGALATTTTSGDGEANMALLHELKEEEEDGDDGEEEDDEMMGAWGS
jgi:ribosomal protein L12E/L44/L45/RPP1/RPP2